MSWCPVSAFTEPPKQKTNFLKNNFNDLDSISVSYENSLPK
jgi:hypothetical protein